MNNMYWIIIHITSVIEIKRSYRLYIQYKIMAYYRKTKNMLITAGKENSDKDKCWPILMNFVMYKEVCKRNNILDFKISAYREQMAALRNVGNVWSHSNIEYNTSCYPIESKMSAIYHISNRQTSCVLARINRRNSHNGKYTPK